MKSDDIKPKDAKKNPIRDKYTQKPSFFKKIKIKYIETIKSIKNIKNNKELGALLTILGEVIMYGILGGLGLIFWIPLSVMTILGSGSILWLIEKKIAGVLSGILGSISLVKIYN